MLKSFRFRIYDPDKDKERVGTLEAKSEQIARKLIKKRKLRLLSLEQVTEITYKSGTQKRAVLTFDEPSQTEYIPKLSERFDEWFRAGFYQILALASIAAVGLLLMIASLWSTSSHKKANQHQAFETTIQGRVRTNGSLDLKSGSYTVRFPELPWRQNFTGEELLDTGGRFEIAVELSTKRKPKTMEFWAEVPGAFPKRLLRVPLLENPEVTKIPTLYIERDNE